MSMTILYNVHQNLYVNLTNHCPCACTFCLRQSTNTMNGSDSLWLDHEPSMEEVLDSLKNFNLKDYKEVVFCGFGEPTERIDLLLEVAGHIKNNYPNPVRINTNGLSDLINGRPTAHLLKGLIDSVSISLNTPNAVKYHDLVRSIFGDKAFHAMLKFAKECTSYVPNVVLTTVGTTLTEEEEAQCTTICKDLGVTYRIRPWED